MLSITEQHAATAYRAGSNAPTAALYRARPALPTLIFQANSPASPVAWSDNGAGGTFAISGANNSIAAYTPWNKTQLIDIAATDTAGTLHYPIQVYGTIPIYPQLGYEIELDIDTKTKTARDGTQYHREDGVPLIGWTFAWDNRQDDEFNELKDFWFNHRKVIPFYLIDTEGNLLNLVKFVSAMKSAPNGANRWAMGATFKGIYQGVTVDSALPPPPPYPTGLHVTGFSTSTISVAWDDMNTAPLDPPTGFTATAESGSTVLLEWDSDVIPSDPTGFTATPQTSTTVLLEWD